MLSVSRRLVSTSTPSTTSNRHSSTPLASGEHTAKFVLSSLHDAPSGKWLPGQTETGKGAEWDETGLTGHIVPDAGARLRRSAKSAREEW